MRNKELQSRVSRPEKTLASSSAELLLAYRYIRPDAASLLLAMLPHGWHAVAQIA
jgi:hypothetical protein